MQHQPDAVLLVEAHLKEVVARSERAEMHGGVGLGELRMLGHDGLEARLQRRPRLVRGIRQVLPRTLVAPAARSRAPVRHGLLQCRAHMPEAVRQIVRGERGAHRHHPAADVHANRRRDDRALGRDHRADGRALAVMHVRHHREPLVDERHGCRVEKLPLRALIHRHAARPHLHRRAMFGRDHVVAGMFRAHGASLPGL